MVIASLMISEALHDKCFAVHIMSMLRDHEGHARCDNAFPYNLGRHTLFLIAGMRQLMGMQTFGALLKGG